MKLCGLGSAGQDILYSAYSLASKIFRFVSGYKTILVVAFGQTFHAQNRKRGAYIFKGDRLLTESSKLV